VSVAVPVAVPVAVAVAATREGGGCRVGLVQDYKFPKFVLSGEWLTALRFSD